MKTKYIFIFSILLILFSGCGLNKKAEKTAPELFLEGSLAFENKKYKNSLKSFQKLRDWYPFSQHIKEATIRIADNHYALKEYTEAAVVYSEFERLYPKHEEAARAVYQLAMCYFQEINTVDRDQNNTKSAFYYFMKLQEDYEGSEYAEKAEEKIKECKESLAGAEYNVAYYYFKTRAYSQAKARLETLMAAFPETSYSEKADKLLKETEEKIKRKEIKIKRKKDKK